ncbi:MAG: hypothetical protein LBP71_01965 [Spirochaetaceae bacterium]|jgi:hypothetical protein|nr:hypothetical protein [Spirochaetaceae bacterium]
MTLKPLVLWGSIFFISANTLAFSQDTVLEDMLPGLRERAVVLDIVARVVEENQQEVWNATNSKVTIPGRPVGLRLVGENIVVAVQFTPYFRNDGNNVLVAQGQIWINVPNEGIRYKTTMQTIPMKFGEQIYFFPLGSRNSHNEAHIEIRLALHPYVKDQNNNPDRNGYE